MVLQSLTPLGVKRWLSLGVRMGYDGVLVQLGADPYPTPDLSPSGLWELSLGWLQVRLRFNLDNKGLVSLSRESESVLNGWNFGTNQVCREMCR